MRLFSEIFLVLVLACTAAGCSNHEKEKRALTPAMGRTQTYCLGRFLVDLPTGLKPLYNTEGGADDATLYFGKTEDFTTVDIGVVGEGMDTERFKQLIKKRSERISADTNYDVNASMLVSEMDLSDSQTLLNYYSNPDIADVQVHELQMLVGDVHVALKAKSYSAKSIPDVLAQLKQVASKVVKVETASNSPTGFCLGPVVVNAGNDYEIATFSFQGRELKHQDVQLELRTNTFNRSEEQASLIKRGESRMSEFGLNPKVLEKGKITLATLPAEQWLGRFEEEGRVLLGFHAETTERAPSQDRPHLHIELSTGDEVANGDKATSSLSDDEAQQVWESVVSSVRLRPSK